MKYLIAETTKEEREQIVRDSLGDMGAECDDCVGGLADMYQDYIDGKKELSQINREFHSHYVMGSDRDIPETNCVMG